MLYFVDSNVFLRFLEFENENFFRESSDFLKKIKLGKIKAATSNIILAEVAWVLTSVYGEEKSKIVSALSGVIKINNLRISDDFETDLAISLFSKNSVKLIDCFIASNPNVQNRKWAVVSYDKDFDKLGVKRVEPAEVLSS